MRKIKPFIDINGENLIQQNDYKGDRRGHESNHGAEIISTVNILLLCDTLGVKLTQNVRYSSRQLDNIAQRIPCNKEQ